MTALWLALTAIAAHAAPIESHPGTAYEPGTHHTVALFHIDETEKDTPQGREIALHYRGIDGREAAWEQALESGASVKHYELHQIGPGGWGTLDVQGGRMTMHYHFADGSERSDASRAPTNLVVGPTLFPYLREHWDALMKGYEIQVRVAVVDRLDDYGFTLKKVGEVTRGGRAVVQVRMEASSLFIRPFVRPAYFEFDRATRVAIAIQGRITPKIFKDGAWRDVDADVVSR